VLVASQRAVDEHGLTPRARVHHLSVRGDDPVWMLTGPIEATRHALARSGLSVDDIDLFECNEAFASVVLAWSRELDVLERTGGRFGLQTMCEGGGQANVTIIERLG
jgi:acetyl-CoA C-acetyltransferase